MSLLTNGNLSLKKSSLSALELGLFSLCICFGYRLSIADKREIHSLDFQGLQSPLAYLQQMVSGIAFGLAPLKWGGGYIILALNTQFISGSETQSSRAE